MLPKLQSITEFLSLNLSDLYDKISLCNISDSSAAKNSIKRQIVQGKGKWICYIYVTTRKRNELEFFSFSSSSFIETRAFNINLINHNNENWNVLPYSTTKMPISILIEKKVITHIAGRHVPCMALQLKWNGLVSNNWTEESVKILARQYIIEVDISYHY